MAKQQDITIDWLFNLFGLIAVLVGGYWVISVYTGTVIPALIEPYIAYISSGLGVLWAIGEMIRKKSSGMFKNGDWAFNLFALGVALMGGIIFYVTYDGGTLPDILLYAYEIGLVFWMALEWFRRP